ncbi:MAG: hypothetical protein JSV20_01910 [Candidatus Bathyarchaeota archaeon]|nr:MAG: hypothetical protein JSV20_01910 [Candidatus Bathyarchaeota archaeon]
MLKALNKDEIEVAQSEGYMCEHLLCLYSTVAYKTELYNDTFPVFSSKYDEADVVLFGLKQDDEDRLGCVKYLSKKKPIKTLNIISPEPLNSLPNTELKYTVLDYHINVNQFDINMKGKKYKSIRYRINQAKKNDYTVKLGRNFSPSHIYLLSRHMTRRKYDAWDFEEMLSLERFLREHNHGMMMEVYKDDKLIGFDVIDFFENRKIMIVPLGIYLKISGLSDLLMYENLKYAKENGYIWLDVGSACGEPKLRRFKEKWFAKPTYKICVQSMKIPPEKN